MVEKDVHSFRSELKTSTSEKAVEKKGKETPQPYHLTLMLKAMTSA